MDLVDSVEDYAILRLDPAGGVESWNAGAERILGYAAEEVVGRHIELFYTEADVDRGWPAEELRRAAETGRFEDEGWRVRKDGTRFFANVVVTPIRDADGELTGFARVTRDLTERRRAELERDAQLEELQNQAAQLEENQEELAAINDELQRTNAELRAAEMHYRRLVDHAPSGVFVLDATGHFTESNEAGARILARPAEEVLGSHFAELVVPEDQDAVQGAFLSLITGAEDLVDLDLGILRPTGEVRQVNVRATCIREGGEITGVHGVARDITEERRVQASLRESEASYRSLFDSLSELVYIQDLDGRFLNVNDAVLRRYGYTRDELIGRTPEMLVDPTRTDLAAVRERFVRACAGEPQRLEFWARTRDGETFPKEVTLARGRHFGEDVIIAVARDISERKRAEVVAERSREFYMSVFDRFPALIWRADQNGSCDYFNRAWLEFTGRSLEEEVGDGWAQGVHPEDHERRLRTSADAYAARDPFEMEYRLRHHTGEYRWIRDLGRPVHNLEGRFIGYIGGAFDIEDHRRTEVQLRQAQKMEAIGRLAGGIAHDFNNVLLVIKGNAQLALMDLPEDSPLRPELEEIGDAAERAAGLTNQLLAFSRQQVLQPRVVDLNQVISDLEKMLRRTLGEDIEFVSVLDPRLGRVRADPGQIEQILMNLAVNARDAMPTGGKLITETRNFELGERLAGSYPYDVQPGSYVMLSISDTGVGMPREVRDRLFEPFFTTKAKGEGTGLGLATVYGIVKQSGGYVWVYSEEGHGSTFTVLLPRIDAEVAAQSRTPDRGTPRRSATILLVEDEAAVRAIARRMLERLGHIVLEAENGEEGLRVAEAHAGEIDLLLTDVVMPVMGGRELAERVVARWPGVRVLYTSGYTDEAVVRHGIQEGSAHFLQKPYDHLTLAEKVAAALEAPAPER